MCLRGDSQRNHAMLAHICVAALALAPGHQWTRPALHAPMNALTALPPRASTPQPRGRIPTIGSFSSCAAANIASAPTRAAPVMAEGAAQSGLEKFSSTFSTLFPLWTLLVAVLGLVRPAVLGSISTDAFTGLLGLLMLSMGITLTIDDFTRVLKQPTIMGVGFAGCYVMMPLLALGLSRVFGLSPALTAGMVLVGSINGGQARTTRAICGCATGIASAYLEASCRLLQVVCLPPPQASNLCTYIARGDVALSVMMTTVTTLGAIFMTPLLSQLLLGAIVPVDALGVAISTIQAPAAPSSRRHPAPGACCSEVGAQPTRSGLTLRVAYRWSWSRSCSACSPTRSFPALSRRSCHSRRCITCWMHKILCTLFTHLWSARWWASCRRAYSSGRRWRNAPSRSSPPASSCRRRPRCFISLAAPRRTSASRNFTVRRRAAPSRSKPR